MDVRRLDLLRELAERGSVTAVAEATHRTPSAVSQQLQTLQRQVGVPLVERVGRGVRLTPHGRVLAGLAPGVATAIARVDAAWQEHLGGTTGPVSSCRPGGTGSSRRLIRAASRPSALVRVTCRSWSTRRPI